MPISKIKQASIDASALTGSNITDGSITAADLATDAVTTAKIASGAVSDAKIAADAVTTAKIADGAITLAKTTGIGGGGKNVIINGEMMISQRQTTSSNVGNQYVLDRFAVYKQNTSSTYTCSQNTVTDLPGFNHSLKMDCTTADTSLASNEQVYIVTKLEGRECQRFAKGHGSDALPITLSFYVKTNKLGVYTVRIFDRDNSRNVSGSYTVANANWNRYTVTFPADALGKLDNDINSSLELFFHLVNGSDTTTGSLVTTWAGSADAGSATGQVNFADNLSNDWEITGIQLETGSTATPFEHRSYREHLTACRRYYETSNPPQNYGGRIAYLSYTTYTTTSGYCTYFYDVEKRTSPTITHGANVWRIYQNGSLIANANGAGGTDGISARNFALTLTGPTYTAHSGGMADYRGDNGIKFDAEL
jgi:hypothetical protein